MVPAALQVSPICKSFWSYLIIWPSLESQRELVLHAACEVPNQASHLCGPPDKSRVPRELR